jgi:hypothetical protein
MESKEIPYVSMESKEIPYVSMDSKEIPYVSMETFLTIFTFAIPELLDLI